MSAHCVDGQALVVVDTQRRHPQAASKTSQRCSMARRMMRSKHDHSLPSVAVLGAAPPKSAFSTKLPDAA